MIARARIERLEREALSGGGAVAGCRGCDPQEQERSRVRGEELDVQFAEVQAREGPQKCPELVRLYREALKEPWWLCPACAADSEREHARLMALPREELLRLHAAALGTEEA